MEKIKKYCNYIGVVGCILLFLGNFLEFASLKKTLLGASQIETIKFIDGDGIFVVICAVVALILILMKKGKWNYLTGGISAIITIYDMSNVKDKVGILGSIANVKVNYGLGFFMILVGAILVLIYAYLYKENDKEILPLTIDSLSNRKDENKVSTKEELSDYQYCGYCGTKNKKGTRFCTHCGKEQ